MRKFMKLGGAAIVLLFVIAGIAGAGSKSKQPTTSGKPVPEAAVSTTPAVSTPSMTTSATAPKSVPAPPSVSAPTPPSTPAPAAKVQTFEGVGQKDLGTIVVPTDSTVSWNCPSCGSTNFIINNADGDDNSFPTNGLDVKQGVDPLPAGTYHTVVVDTDASGAWTVRITPGSGTESSAPATPAPSTPAPAGKVQTFEGVGQKDLGTIVVPTDSTVSWNCPSCGNTNFIINNADGDDNSFPTNGLDVKQGVDPLPAGTYHTVVVDTDAAGAWTVRITPGS
jgi:predicted RNA-binding Zn-ribbon protein involved in translation (DUF1610 family)